MKGILFRPDVLKAKLKVLEQHGEAQTRRVIKPQFKIDHEVFSYQGKTYVRTELLERGKNLLNGCIPARYQIGGVVYVKEAYSTYGVPPNEKAFYKDERGIAVDFIAWHSPLFMPQRYGRYFIRIKDIRVERLQEITEKDAIAEGCQLIARTIQAIALNPHPHLVGPERPFTHCDHFVGIWDSINEPPYDWESNPWVWVYVIEPAKGD